MEWVPVTEKGINLIPLFRKSSADKKEDLMVQVQWENLPYLNLAMMTIIQKIRKVITVNGIEDIHKVIMMKEMDPGKENPGDIITMEIITIMGAGSIANTNNMDIMKVMEMKIISTMVPG